MGWAMNESTSLLAAPAHVGKALVKRFEGHLMLLAGLVHVEMMDWWTVCSAHCEYRLGPPVVRILVESLLLLLLLSFQVSQ
jgi:hypothetical protein